MVAGGLPTVQVLLDDGTGTFPYDITTAARVQHTVSRGRQDEQSQVTPGQCSLSLDNNDGRFTLGSTTIASPSPIKVNQRIRVKETVNATTYTRFTGYVQQWPVEWPTGSDLESRVTVVATDAQARGERWPLRSIVEEELGAVTAHYPLGEPAGATSAADTSGNQAPLLTVAGTGAAMGFGSSTGATTDGLTAANFAGGEYLTTQQAGPTTPSPLGLVLIRTGTPAAAETVFSGFGCELVLETSGKLSVYRLGSFQLQTAGSICDGLVHVAGLYGFVGAGQLAVDDAVIGTWASLGVSLTYPQRLSFGGGGVTAAAGLTGTLAHIVFGAVPSYASVSTGFSGESGTARLTRLAGYGSISLGTLDTSLTNVPFTNIAGRSVSDAIREVADAELGLAFYDGAGNLTFHNRNRGPLKTAADIILTADVLDPGTAFQVDTQGLLNYYETTASGTSVTQIIRDTTSETTHGRYSGSASYLVSTNAEALDRANWVVETHSDPAARVGSLTVDLMVLDAATQSSLLAAEPNTWIRVTGLPSQTPGGTTADLVVQGFTESLTKDGWSITFNVVNRSIFTAWILGDATYGVLGTTTKLYV